MKLAVLRTYFVFLAILLNTGCSNNDFFVSSPFSTNPSYPTKEILINNGRYDKPYETLAPIEYTLKKQTSFFVDQLELRNQAIDYLKQAALARYGNKVDAIVDVKVEENTEDNFDGKLSITHVQGVAIAFIPEAKTINKNKAKSSKNIPSRIKSTKNGSNKSQTEDIEITPSELLK